MSKSKAKKVKITLVRSLHGRLKKHQASLKSLGLSRMHQSVERYRTPTIDGMIRKVHYLIQVEEL